MARKKRVSSDVQNVDRYLKEYRELAHRIEHIRRMLDFLQRNFSEIESEVKINLNEIESATIRVFNASTKSNSAQVGRPSKWGSYIIHRLTQQGVPMTYSDLMSAAAEMFGRTSAGDEENFQRVIFSTVHRLRKEDKVATFGVKGQRQKFIGLRSWFTGSKKLKKGFREKLEAVGEKVVRNSEGRIAFRSVRRKSKMSARRSIKPVASPVAESSVSPQITAVPESISNLIMS